MGFLLIIRTWGHRDMPKVVILIDGGYLALFSHRIKG